MMRFLVSILLLTLAMRAIAAPNPAELADILNHFEKYAEQAMQDWDTPGMAIAIVEGDKIIYAKGFGVKEYGKNDPVDTHTLFAIGSDTKAFTSALVAKLIEENKFKWKDSLADILPNFKLNDPWVSKQFMVLDMMAQRSGLPAHACDEVFGIKNSNREQIIRCLRYVKPQTSFRAQFAYQNTFFIVAGKLIEKYAGESYSNYLAERILRPLGMNETVLGMEAYMGEKNRALGHDVENHKIAVHQLTEEDKHVLELVTSAGGINSNVLDMAQWIKLQISNGSIKHRKILSEASVKFLHTPQVSLVNVVDPALQIFPEFLTQYAQGWFLASYHPYPVLYHAGEIHTGYRSQVFVVPEAKIGIVILTNRWHSYLPDALGNKFIDLYFNNPPRDWSREFLNRKN